MIQEKSALLLWGSFNIGLVYFGYLILKNGLIGLSWGLLPVVIIANHVLFLSSNPVLRMFTLVATSFILMKIVVAAISYQHRTRKLTIKQWLSFCCTWVGMQPRLFEHSEGRPLAGGKSMIVFGISRIALGILFVFLARYLRVIDAHNTLINLLVIICLLIGLSLVLHFGILSIQAGLWRLAGINTYLLFRKPLKSRSLTEFWGKRWNIAFIEMNSIAVFRPLKVKFGSNISVFLGFVYSGLLHEVALCLSVQKAYGSALLYFVIQGLIVCLEQQMNLRQVDFLKKPAVALLWTSCWLILPAPLLFNSHFLSGVLFRVLGLDFHF